MAAGRKEYELLMRLTGALDSSFSGSFKTAMDTTKKLQNTLKDVKKVQGDISAYEKTQKAIGANKTSLNELGKKHISLQQELGKTVAKENDLQTALEKSAKATGTETQEYKRLESEIKKTQGEKEKLAKQINSNETATDKLNRKIEEEEKKLSGLSEKLQAAGVNTDNLSEENKKLEKSYERVQKAQEDYARVNKAIDDNKAAISATRSELVKTVGIVTGAGTAFYKGFIQPAANLQEQMSVVAAISGATAEDMEKLTALSKEMGATTKFTAIESGQALEYMAMAGWKPQEMLDGLGGIMTLAAASGEDLARVSDIVTDALTAFGLTAADSGHFADVLAAASANSNTNVAMLGESFKYAAPLAGAFGFSIEDTALMLGLMANAGIKASQGGTSMRKIFSALSDELEIVQKDGSKVTVMTENADGSMRELKDIIDDVRVAFNGMPLSEIEAAQNDLINTAKELNIELMNESGTLKTQAELYNEVQDAVEGLTAAGKVQEAESIAGKTAMAGFLSIINASEEDYNNLTNAINNAEGAAAQMEAVRMDNLSGDIVLAQSAWDGFATSVGEIFLPSMREAVQGITGVLTSLNAFVQENPEFIKTLVAGAAGLAGIKIAGLTAKLGFLEAKGGILQLAKGFFGIKANIAESAAAAAIGNGKISKLGEAFSGYGKGVSDYFSGAGKSISGVGSALNNLSGGKLSALLPKDGNGMQSGILKSLSGIGSKVTGTMGDVPGKVIGVFNGIGSKIAAGPLGKVGGVFKSLGRVMGSVLGGPLKGLGGLFGGLFGKAMPLIAIISALSILFLKIGGEDISGFIEPLKQAFADMQPVLENIMEQFKELAIQLLPILMDLFTTLAPLLGQIVTAVLPVLLSLIELIMPIIIQLVQSVLPIIAAALEAILPLIVTLIEAALPVLMALIEALMPVIEILASVFTEVLGAAVFTITGILDGVITMLGGIIKFITGVFTGDWEQAWEGVKEIFGGAFAALEELVKAPFRGIVSLINGVIGGMNKMSVPDWVPKFGGIKISIPLLPTFEKGTNSTPDTFIAGDVGGKGGELVTNAKGRKVFTAAETDTIFANINRAKEINASAIAATVPETGEKPLTLVQQIGGSFGLLRDTTINHTEEMRTPPIPPIPTVGGEEKQYIIQYNPVIENNGGNVEELEEKLQRHTAILMQMIKDWSREQEEKRRRTEYA